MNEAATEQLPDAVQAALDEWQEKQHAQADAEPRPALDLTDATPFVRKDEAALEGALDRMGVEVRYNLRAAREEFRERDGKWGSSTDRAASKLRQRIATQFTYISTHRGDPAPLRFGRETWADYLNALLYDREVDPFRTWLLEALPVHDGEPRGAKLLAGGFDIDKEKTDPELAAWASTYLTLGAVWRTFDPGHEQHEMPVIVGPQGIGKTTLLKWLIPPEHRHEWYSASLNLAADAKKRVEALLGPVIVECGEMAGSNRAELANLKQFLTDPVDHERLTWRRNPEALPRRCIIAGTANDDSLPNDPTGNRRFVAVHVTAGRHEALRAYLDEHRLQVWAEAVHLHDKGIEARLPQVLEDQQAASNEYSRRCDDVLEDVIDRWLHGKKGSAFTLAEAIVGAGLEPNEQEAVKVLQRDMRRVGAVLTRHGYGKRQERRPDGSRAMVWRAAA